MTSTAANEYAAISVDSFVDPPILAIDSLTKDYASGRRALDGVSLHVRAGELVVVLGANGSGKSTLLRCAVRLIDPTSGSVHIGGKDLALLKGSQLREARRQIAMIFQSANLVRRRSALVNVATGSLGRHHDLGTGFGWLPREEVLHAATLLERVGLLPLANRRADTLSGGESQRVAIARGLAQRPRVLLADEPVASLDPEAAEDVLVLLRRLATDDRLAVVCVLHQPDLAVRHAHRLVGLSRGRVMFDARVEDVTTEMIGKLYLSEDR